MKKNLLFATCIAISAFNVTAQVTQLNNNKSLQVVVPLKNGITFLYSGIDSSIWVTNGTLAGTVPLATNIKFNGDNWGLLNGKIIFKGYTLAAGSELFISDGTTGGTGLVKDINGGTGDSDPGDFVLLNSNLYFSADNGTLGRELWKTNGTTVGTIIVKDIDPGIASSLDVGNTTLFSNGSFLLFAANTSAGRELWKSDGTSAGTILLKDINTGHAGADSSNPDNFAKLNNIVVFSATDATHGTEIWRTDGTSVGTVLVKDINTGTGSAITNSFIFFHIFNNKAYFNATDGASTGEIWSTDGTIGNATLIKDFGNTFFGFALFEAINFPNKFIFSFSDGINRFELWQCDGTSVGTVLFKSFTSGTNNFPPIIFLPYGVDFVNQTLSYPLFQGNKFFFAAATAANGYELWVSDGTLGGTNIVKDINPGTADGIANNFSYTYTSQALFFAAEDGTHGNELWQTDGTSGNTSLVKDIYLNAGDADPQLTFVVYNEKVFFTATDGDDPNATDLYVVGGTFTPLPITLTDFTVTPKDNDALLQWSTQQEINTKSFTIQRSYDGQQFNDIGSVAANGTTSTVSKYSFTDAGIMNSGKQTVYYRLKAIDKDGKFALTNIISLKIAGNTQWSVRVLSNPVRDYISLLLNNVSGKLQLSVRDISGKIIYAKSMENVNGQISLPVTLPRGTYILEAENNNERKIIKLIK